MTIDTLHIKHGNYLLTCLRLYGVPEQECEDVRQDIYLRLLENKRDLTKIARPRGFCSKIARDAATDWMRKANRAPSVESMIVIDENGVEGLHPKFDALAVASWDAIITNPNTERIAQALELAQMYECDTDITAYDVLADLLYGLTMTQVGEKHNVSKATVSRWVRDWYLWVSEKLPKGATS